MMRGEAQRGWLDEDVPPPGRIIEAMSETSTQIVTVTERAAQKAIELAARDGYEEPTCAFASWPEGAPAFPTSCRSNEGRRPMTT